MSEQGIYKAIVAVAADIAKTGIGKNRNNAQQGYKFRGIDDVYNEMAPLLAKHNICILPRTLGRTCTERATAKGGLLFSVIVEMEFDFVCSLDGSKHTVKTFGEAMDSGDKATNKAMSAAYKYAAFQAFCIPTEGDNDADAPIPDPVKLDDAILATFNTAATTDELATAWKAIPVGSRAQYTKSKDEAKARVAAAKVAEKTA
jgi:hypothetical protein